MSEARIRLSIKDGIFEIEGTETFVSAQLQAFGDVFRKALSEPAKANVLMPDQHGPEEGPMDTQVAGFPSVFQIHEGKVKLLKHIPGAKTKEKTINAALICLFARSQQGIDTVPFSDIIEICTDHSCYDPNNFSRYLKSDKQDFVFGGSRGKQTVKLSVPGTKRAEALVKELVA
ncbi:MAG: hypothetical protein WCD80_13980 [Desulfobaccales bacterium]